MRIWLRVAYILAREAAYRAQRRLEGGRSLTLLSGSIFRVNMFGIVAWTIVSIMVMAPILIRIYPITPSIFIGILILEFTIGIFISLVIMINNLNTLQTDRLIDMIRHLPIRENDVRLSLIGVSLYWGIIPLPFLVIPSSLIATYITGEIHYIISGLLTSIFMLSLSVGLGFLLGGIGGRISRSLPGRIFSTILWLIVLGSGVLFSIFGTDIYENIYGMDLDPSINNIYYLLPMTAFTYIFMDPLISIPMASIWIFSGLTVLKIGIDRFWESLNIVYGAPAHRGLGRGLMSILMDIGVWREILMLSRSPRMLANIIYLLLFPIVIPLIFGSGSLPLINCSLGIPLVIILASLSSPATYILYVLEGEGARYLYQLPISRGDIIRSKAYTVSILSTPVSIFYMIYVSMLCGFSRGFMAMAAYLITILSSSLLSSYLDSRLLPSEPSIWTPQTFSNLTKIIHSFIIVLIYFSLAFVGAIPFIIRELGFTEIYVILAINEWLSSLMVYTVSVIILLIIYYHVSKLRDPL